MKKNRGKTSGEPEKPVRDMAELKRAKKELEWKKAGGGCKNSLETLHAIMDNTREEILGGTDYDAQGS